MMKSSLHIRNRIDDLCDDFDRAWNGHSPNAIADVLARIDVGLRSDLFRELIQIDRERCSTAGQSLNPASYAVHFPEYAHLLDDLLAPQHTDQVAGNHIRSSSERAWSPLPEACCGELVGPYRLNGRIGEGGMGVVYRAEHEDLGRSVALKVVACPLADAVPRFQAEARMIARLNHPHIVQMFETGVDQKRPYLALELMQGGSLRDRLQHTVVSPTQAAEIVFQIAGAVAAAHEIGIIHRDLKPANVLMDQDGLAKLADFGLARNLNVDSQTVSGTLLGTPGFMSPEQTVGDDPTVAMDIYGLGAVLYAALTGRPPFRGANIPDTLAMVRERDPVPIRAFVPSVPVNLESICLKSLQRKPAARYASAAELAEELKAFLEGRPVKARPTGALEKLCRWARRNPSVSLLSAGLLITVLVGSAGVIREWRRAEANAIASLHQAERADAQTVIAQEEAAMAAAVNEFTLDILAAAQSSRLGRKATVREAVAAAIDRVDGAFEGRPRIEAAVRTTLGDTLRSLDEAGLCIDQYDQALALSRAEYGSSDARTLRIMDRLAGALRSFGGEAERTEAARLRESVLEHRMAKLGETHPDSIDAMNNLANVYLSLDDFARAETLYRRAIELVGQHPESDQRDANPLRYHLALIHQSHGQLELAAAQLQAIIEDYRKSETRDEGLAQEELVDLLNTENALADVLHDLERTAEAAAIYERVLEQRRELLGRSHHHTLSTHRRLTRLLVERKDFQKALPLLEDCLSLHNERFDKSSSLTIGVRKSLTATLIGLQKFGQAEELLKQTVDVVRDERGPDHRYTLAAQERLDEFLKAHAE